MSSNLCTGSLPEASGDLGGGGRGMHNLKAEDYVSFSGQNEGLKPRIRPLRGLRGGARVYRNSYNKDKVTGTSKDCC